MYVWNYWVSPILASEGAAESGRADIEFFLDVLDKVPLLLLAIVTLWVTHNAWIFAQKSAETTMWEKIKEGFGRLWGANAVDGQAIMLAVTHIVFYYIDLWYGVPAKLEVAMVLAVSSVFATLLLAATDFDQTEKFPLWGLTFLASSSFGAILASLFADMRLGYLHHEAESVVPSMLWNIIMLILIGICYWMAGVMSRNARWHRFMSINPPQSVLVVLNAARIQQNHVGADAFVKAFLGTQYKAAVDIITALADLYVQDDKEVVLSAAVAAVKGFSGSLDTSPHGGHHDDDEHTTHLHPG